MASNYSPVGEAIEKIEIVCPNCGTNINNNFFAFWIDSKDFISEIIFNKKLNKYISRNIKFNKLDINLIRCLSCNYINKKEFFEKESNNKSIAHVKKIDDKYTLIKQKNKIFYISTNIVPRNINENDKVIISGVMPNEISNGDRVDDQNIIIRKANNDE